MTASPVLPTSNGFTGTGTEIRITILGVLAGMIMMIIILCANCFVTGTVLWRARTGRNTVQCHGPTPPPRTRSSLRHSHTSTISLCRSVKKQLINLAYFFSHTHLSNTRKVLRFEKPLQCAEGLISYAKKLKTHFVSVKL